jgi:hypothetical protein
VKRASTPFKGNRRITIVAVAVAGVVVGIANDGVQVPKVDRETA